MAMYTAQRRRRASVCRASAAARVRRRRRGAHWRTPHRPRSGLAGVPLPWATGDAGDGEGGGDEGDGGEGGGGGAGGGGEGVDGGRYRSSSRRCCCLLVEVAPARPGSLAIRGGSARQGLEPQPSRIMAPRTRRSPPQRTAIVAVLELAVCVVAALVAPLAGRVCAQKKKEPGSVDGRWTFRRPWRAGGGCGRRAAALAHGGRDA